MKNNLSEWRHRGGIDSSQNQQEKSDLCVVMVRAIAMPEQEFGPSRKPFSILFAGIVACGQMVAFICPVATQNSAIARGS